MLQAPSTRTTLIIRLSDVNDDDAWRQFLELYAPPVYRLYRLRGLQDADAADLTQEVLRAVAMGAGRSDYDRDRGPFRSWLYGVARNKLVDYLRCRDRHPRGTGDSATLDLLQSIPGDEDEIEQWELAYQRQLFSVAADKVRAVVDESTWQAFWQTAVDGRPAREVALALEMSVGAVYVAKSRVVARIKEHITQIERDEA